VSDLTTAIMAKLVKLDGVVENAVSEFPKLDSRIGLTERTLLERVADIETKVDKIDEKMDQKIGEKMDVIANRIGVSLVISNADLDPSRLY
jgi:hypothetical protein